MNKAYTPQEWLIPYGIRKKTVISRVSREIFFIDCLNDLKYCAQNHTSYNLIRASVILRMLLLDRGIPTINKNYQVNISLLANPNNLGGTALTTSEMKDIWHTMLPLQNKLPSIKYLKLIQDELAEHKLDAFLSKICISFSLYQVREYNFSVRNIIKLIANNHGAAHLEHSFDSTALDSFHLDEYNPFSMINGNKFLLTIRELIIIVLEALKPLAAQVIQHLIIYNANDTESKVTRSFRKVLSDKGL